MLVKGNPISAYLFIVALEVHFALIKNKFDIKGIDLYDYSFLFTADAEDSTFFLKDISSVKMLVETFKQFSCFSQLKPNSAKCKIDGLGPMKRICGLKTVALSNDAIKIPGIHFSYHNETNKKQNFWSTV